MEALVDPKIRVVSIIASIQSGKTSVGEFGLAHIIANHPGPTLWLDQTDDCEPNDKQRAEGVMGFKNHGWVKGGRVVGKRPGAGADDGDACLTGSGAPGRKPSPESDA